jgi:hypothetical protein
MAISASVLKALTEITGEPRAELAIREIMKDSIEHRIEKIENEIKALEKKHSMNFKEFEQKFQKEQIPNQYSYEIEKDYLEWEGLETRLTKYRNLLEFLF